MSKPEIVLCFFRDGTALLTVDDETEWASDQDEEFREEFEDEHLTVDDAEEVLEYLEDEGYLEPDEVPLVEIEEETDDELSPSDAIETESEDGENYVVKETNFGNA